MEENLIKKNEMKEDITYILCPDKTCNIFFDENKLCEYDCPLKEKAKKLFYCKKCKKIEEKPLTETIHRLDHLCMNNTLASIFPNKKHYIIIHEFPKE